MTAEQKFPHGTRVGYVREVRMGQGTCPDCRLAAAEYARKLREDPARKARHNRIVKAESRARIRLARMYPDDYFRLLDVELESIPLPPIEDRRRVRKTADAQAE